MRFPQAMTRLREPRLQPARLLAATCMALLASSVVTTSPPAFAQAAVQLQGRELPDFADLAERVSPSVVNIRTMAATRRSQGGGGGGAEIDEQMREFFRRFGIPLPNGPLPGMPRRGAPEEGASPQQRGVGSGFILSPDGFVMTNAHVVDGADEVIVTMTDKREFKARIIGFDKRTDVAVVKVDASALPAVKIGDVNKLRVGEWVAAIGSPFGLDNTVTAGIVSAKQRDTGDYLPLIQTDVAINPGNSGGPLLNLRGEVVGINSQIYSRSGMFGGISFAIPIDEAMRVADQLRATGRVVRGRIGVTIGPVTKEVAESIGLGRTAGAMVSAVEEGGPAAKAGVEAGDIITKVDGRAVEKAGDLPRLIGGTKPGSKAVLQVFRRGSTRDLGVTVAELEPEQAQRSAQQRAEPQAAAASKTAIGVTVVDLPDAKKRELKLQHGVQVEAVDGAAARAGVMEGDVILAVGNTEISDAKQFATVVGKLDRSRPVSLLVRRGEWTSYLVLNPAR